MPTFHIEDMTCGHCASTIARAVRALDAGARLRVDIQARLIHIEPSEADEAELVEAISEAGYQLVTVAGPAQA